MNSSDYVFDIVDVIVNLTDINDKTPVFEQAQYDEPLPENSPAGTPVVNISVSTLILLYYEKQRTKEEEEKKEGTKNNKKKKNKKK